MTAVNFFPKIAQLFFHWDLRMSEQNFSPKPKSFRGHLTFRFPLAYKIDTAMFLKTSGIISKFSDSRSCLVRARISASLLTKALLFFFIEPPSLTENIPSQACKNTTIDNGKIDDFHQTCRRGYP